MGTTLRDPDFETTRGPLIDYGNGVFDVGDPVPYTMGPDIQGHYPTDGSPKTFYNVCIVAADKKDQFLRSILPDVYEDTAHQDTTQFLTMAPYGADWPIQYYRNPLVRLHPQRHPVHRRAFVVDAQEMSGLGFPIRNNQNELTFRTIGAPDDEDNVVVDGFIKIGVTWRDLPYEVEIEDIQTNNPLDSEIRRYCLFKPAIKGSNLQVSGGNVFFVDDNGTLIRTTDDPTSPYFTIPETRTFPVPAATYSVTLRMVPRVPLAAQLMQGMCNQTNTIQFPVEILKEIPDVGTLTYLGYELSDPYYTVSDRKVFDITYALGYRPSGDGPKRGWNAAFCAKRMAMRRIIVGILSGTSILNPVTGEPFTTFPISSDLIADQSNRLVTKDGNLYNFAELANLFKFEGDPVPGSSGF